MTNSIRNANVHLPVESSKSPESRINGVWSVGGGHHDDVGSLLETVHQGQELGDDSPLNLTVGLLSLRSNTVKFINEDDGWRVLLSLLKSFPQVTFRFSSHLGHNLRSIDQEEECSSLVGHSSGHQSLTSTWRSIEKD